MIKIPRLNPLFIRSTALGAEGDRERGTEGQRDKVIEEINLFFFVSFRLTHLTSSSSTFLYLYIPTSLHP